MIINFFGKRFFFLIQRKYRRIVITIGWKRNYIKRKEECEENISIDKQK
jgi:hypothetical protein